MKPDFKNIKISEVVASKTEPSDKLWLTPEQIKVKNIYTKEDIAGMEHLNYVAGLPPFLRGPYSGMYATISTYQAAKDAAKFGLRTSTIGYNYPFFFLGKTPLLNELVQAVTATTMKSKELAYLRAVRIF